jgi:hypothetical protein
VSQVQHQLSFPISNTASALLVLDNLPRETEYRKAG